MPLGQPLAPSLNGAVRWAIDDLIHREHAQEIRDGYEEGQRHASVGLELKLLVVAMVLLCATVWGTMAFLLFA